MSTHQSAAELAIVHPDAAGIDIGAQFHVVAVSPERDDQPVRSFRSFTQDLHALASWLKAVGITSVAMESTGVYWVPAYEVLEAHGFEVFLVNAREAKNVPGRKTDVNDAQWLQKLHQFGLLRASFQPHQELAALRSYLRQRERLLEYAAAHIQHMQKALMQMNLQLQHVVTDMTGATGMRIVRAILAGEHRPEVLASFRDSRCKASEETIRQALIGNYRTEHLFALQQAVTLYDCYQEQVAQCDQHIEQVLHDLATCHTAPPKARHRCMRQRNGFAFDARVALYAMLGQDLTRIHGMGPYLALKLVAECGNDMTRWPSAKHFTSWLCLAPGNKISGGKVLSSKTRRSSSRAAAALRLAATTIGKTETALGAFYRRLSARVGKAKAVTATARKIAVLFYNALRYGMDYVDPGAGYYEARYRERVVKQLTRRAASLGYELQAMTEPVGVS
ncbi:IS110 family transposase [Crenobacter cavernae]|uniref:IS110 family transposase n=1 Tax=Crenobacter cavernae TaxID=2290923 RepID=A0ABY0FC54_9NEIS|nr:IS110 family transposase [Crenobacter cavernae]RXZ43676.1 IS110 family transposase [Crenobacter cavernae]